MASTERSWRPAGLAELAAVVGGLTAVAVGLTWPLAAGLGSHGYKLHTAGDAQYSVWNVGWVAHALLTDPRNLFNANIFYPHRGTLVYSEANLAAGVLGVPVYWLTGNVFATHNFVVLLSFVLSGAGTYYLVRHLVRDRGAAAICAVSFAFCPYVFGHLPHIQLLMTAGIPFSLLAFHRLVDRPAAGRGAALGAAMGAQALACAYYAVFVALIISVATVATAAAARRQRNAGYWKAIALAAAVAVAIVLPLFIPYMALQRGTGFARTLDESRAFSATWPSYRTAAAYAASWFVPPASEWTDTLFPGFITTVFGMIGAIAGWVAGGRLRYVAGLYGVIATLAFWLSFGPDGGLYALAYPLPAFSFLRAPVRFGVVVVFALTVLSAIPLAALLRRSSRSVLAPGVLLALAVAERAAPIPITPVPEIPRVYYVLAMQPDGAVLDLPPLSDNRNYRTARTRFMIGSTIHWKPIVSAYSDYIPEDFTRALPVLAQFPSEESLPLLRSQGIRYVVFHLEEYRRAPGELTRLESKLQAFAPHLKLLFGDGRHLLYELIGETP